MEKELVLREAGEKVEEKAERGPKKAVYEALARVRPERIKSPLVLRWR
jgi:hypothetical protein